MSKILIFVIVFAIIWQLSCGIGLNCTFDILPYTVVGYIYTCTAGILIDQEREIITAVFGAHQSDMTDSHVLGLAINNRGMEYFPVNIAQFFPNIKVLEFTNNYMSYVSNQHLLSLPNLAVLNLSANRITSLDSTMLSGLEKIQWIRFNRNNIKHVGHDFLLLNTGYISLLENPCINSMANTHDAIMALRFSLLVNCPPTISQIEDTLESRPNWLTNVNGQVQNLSNRTDVMEQIHSEMDDEVKMLTNTVADLENRNWQLTNDVTELTDEVTDLQQRNLQLTNQVTDLQKSNVELSNEVAELINEVTDLQKSNFEFTNEVTELTNEVVDLRQSNMELINRNSQLETRLGYVDTRAGYLEVIVAALEAIIENKIGLKIY